MNDAVCEIFKSGRWDELNRSAFVTFKYHNPENLIFQHFPIKEKVNNPYKNSSLQAVNRSQNGIIIDTLNSVDIVEIVKCRDVVLEVYEGFFCYHMECNPYIVFVNGMVAKRDLYNKQGKELLQTVFKKLFTRFTEERSGGMLKISVNVLRKTD